MDYKSINSYLGNISLLAVPLMLLISNKKGLNFMNFNLKLDEDWEGKSELIDNIKPYFSFEEQRALNKVQDIVDILNKINKIKTSNYNNEALALTDEISNDEKRERILVEISKHLNGRSREMANGIIETRKRFKQANERLSNQNEITSKDQLSKVDTFLDIIKCFKPIINEKDKKKITKFEKVLEIVKKPEDEF